jgi:hypothetical protein
VKARSAFELHLSSSPTTVELASRGRYIEELCIRGGEVEVRSMSVGVRAVLLVAAWIPILAMLGLSRNGDIGPGQKATIVVALAVVSLVVTLGVLVAKGRKDRRVGEVAAGQSTSVSRRAAELSGEGGHSMPTFVRVAIMLIAWAPLGATYFAVPTQMPPEGVAIAIAAVIGLVAIAIAVNVAVVSAWIREARGTDLPSPGVAVPISEPTTFEFSQQSWGATAALFGGLMFVVIGQSLARGPSRFDVTFVSAVALLFGATFGLITWKGRHYVDVFDDRIRVQQAFWRNREELESAEGIPIGAVTRVVIDRGWGNWGSAPGIGIYAEGPEGDDAASIPLGARDRQEGERCLSRVLELVSPEVVDEGVLHLKNALDLLEEATGVTGETSMADRALCLVSEDKLEEAAKLLSVATQSAQLRRAGSELDEVVRAVSQEASKEA